MTTTQNKRRKLVQREWTLPAKQLRKAVTQLRIQQLARILRVKP